MTPLTRIALTAATVLLLPASLLAPPASATETGGNASAPAIAARAQGGHPETKVGYFPKRSSKKIRKVYGGLAVYTPEDGMPCGEYGPAATVRFTWWVRQVTAKRAKVVKLQMKFFANREGFIASADVYADRSYWSSSYLGITVPKHNYYSVTKRFGKKKAGRWLYFTKSQPRLEAKLSFSLGGVADMCGGGENRVWNWMFPS